MKERPTPKEECKTEHDKLICAVERRLFGVLSITGRTSCFKRIFHLEPDEQLREIDRMISDAVTHIEIFRSYTVPYYSAGLNVALCALAAVLGLVAGVIFCGVFRG